MAGVVSGMPWLWYVGQAGICIEIVGAGFGVWFALDTGRRWRKLNPGSYGGMGPGLAEMKAEFMSQFPKQLAAFGLIGAGLVLQFVGNFVN